MRDPKTEEIIWYVIDATTGAQIHTVVGRDATKALEQAATILGKPINNLRLKDSGLRKGPCCGKQT